MCKEAKSGLLSRRTFVATLTAGTFLTGLRPAFAATDSMSKIFCYVGCYTSHAPQGTSGNGQGIYQFEMNRRTGVLTPVTVFTDIASPSYITLSPDNRFLYALSEIDDFNKEGDGCVTSYSVDQATGALTKMNVVSSRGAVPCYISVHPSGKYLFVANYVGGSVAVLPIHPDGRLGEATDVVRNSGPRQPDRAMDNPPGNFAISDHSKSHLHMIASDPSGKWVVADDAGLDRVYVWSLDMKRGKLIPAATPFYNVEPGSAPRHFVFNHAGNILYNLSEQNSRVAVSHFNGRTGAISQYQSVSTVTSAFRGSTLGAEILLSASGKYLYVSNRLGDSIAVFAVGTDGALNLLDEVWSHADYGRAMMFDPTDAFLFVANQRSDSVTSFRVNREDGELTFTHQFTPIGSPTTFAFLVAQN